MLESKKKKYITFIVITALAATSMMFFNLHFVGIIVFLVVVIPLLSWFIFVLKCLPLNKDGIPLSLFESMNIDKDNVHVDKKLLRKAERRYKFVKKYWKDWRKSWERNLDKADKAQYEETMSYGNVSLYRDRVVVGRRVWYFADGGSVSASMQKGSGVRYLRIKTPDFHDTVGYDIDDEPKVRRLADAIYNASVEYAEWQRMCEGRMADASKVLGDIDYHMGKSLNEWEKQVQFLRDKLDANTR